MNNVVDINRRVSSLDSSGSPPHDGDMKERVAILETLIKSLATKSDLEALRTDIERGQKENRAWMLGTVIALFLGVLAAANFIAVGLRDSRPAPVTAQQPPVIVLPAQPGMISAPQQAAPQQVPQPQSEPSP